MKTKGQITKNKGFVLFFIPKNIIFVLMLIFYVPELRCLQHCLLINLQ